VLWKYRWHHAPVLVHISRQQPHLTFSAISQAFCRLWAAACILAACTSVLHACHVARLATCLQVASWEMLLCRHFPHHDVDTRVDLKWKEKSDDQRREQFGLIRCGSIISALYLCTLASSRKKTKPAPSLPCPMWVSVPSISKLCLLRVALAVHAIE
jgi:hypothetical protein